MPSEILHEKLHPNALVCRLIDWNVNNMNKMTTSYQSSFTPQVLLDIEYHMESGNLPIFSRIINLRSKFKTL